MITESKLRSILESLPPNKQFCTFQNPRYLCPVEQCLEIAGKKGCRVNREHITYLERKYKTPKYLKRFLAAVDNIVSSKKKCWSQFTPRICLRILDEI